MKHFFILTLLTSISSICFAQSSKYFGLYSPKGQALIKPNTYSYRNMSPDKLILVTTKKNNFGLISRKGELLISPDKVNSYDKFMNLPQYKMWVGSSSWATQNLYDNNNDTISYSCDIFGDCNLSTLQVKGNIIEGTKSNKRKILYNYKEKRVIVKQFFAKPLSGKYWAICPSNSYSQWGVIDDNGHEIIPCIYERIDAFMDGVFKIRSLGKYGLVDTNNEILVPFVHHDKLYSNDSRYTFVSDFRNGYAIADLKEKEYKYGVIDYEGNVMIDFGYEKIDQISDNYFQTYDSTLGWNTYYVSKEGAFPLVCQDQSKAHDLSSIHQLTENCIVLRMKDGDQIADKLGNKIADLVDKEFVSASADIIIVRDSKNKYGTIDFFGNVVMPCKWDYAEFYFDNVAVWKNKKRSIWSYFKKKKVIYYI